MIDDIIALICFLALVFGLVLFLLIPSEKPDELTPSDCHKRGGTAIFDLKDKFIECHIPPR